MAECMKDGGRLLYCDTDSIFAAYKLEDMRSKCGGFEWLKTYKDGVFAAPKVYALKGAGGEDEIKIKGVSVKDVEYAQFKDAFYNNESICFENQLIFNKANFDLRQTYIRKSIPLFLYDKRRFILNKSSTQPLMANVIDM